jgi:hypothetical protein
MPDPRLAFVRIFPKYMAAQLLGRWVKSNVNAFTHCAVLHVVAGKASAGNRTWSDASALVGGSR